MFDIGMSELLIIGVVALIVVGPKDLPGMFRTLGRFTAKIRAMGREFSRAMESAADEAGVNDIKSSLNAAANPAKFGLDKLKDAATDFEKWDPMKSGEDTPSSKVEMDDDRVEIARQISEATAAKATARKAAETTSKPAEIAKAAPAKKPTTAKKPAAPKKPAAAKKTASKKTATAKPKPAVKPKAAAKPKAASAKIPKPKKEDKA